MPLPLTSLTDLGRHLDALGIGVGDAVVVHSRLIAFGLIEGGPAALGDLLRRRVGQDGSVVVPCYTFDAAVAYDPGSRPGEGTGALSEYVRQQPDALRSRCPIHNHAGIGPAAAVLRQSDPACSLGPGSDFELLHRQGFTLLLLGCGFNEGCTYLHHLEAVMEVPYRRWITLERQVMDEAREPRVQPCRYFARARDDLISDFAPVERRMAEAGLLRSAPCPFGQSHACRLEDLHRTGIRMLTDDPYALVRSA